MLPRGIGFIFKRLLSYFLTMWGAITISFVLFHLVPGDPITNFLYSIERQYSIATPDSALIIAEYKKMFGLDKDIFTQYISYLRELLKGNMGPSWLAFPTPAQVLISRALPWTIGLLLISIMISWTLGNIIGAFIGWKKGSKIDSAIASMALVLSQIPYYIFAVTIILGIAYIIGRVPYRGAFSGALTPELSLGFIINLIEHATLPSLSLIAAGICGWIISMRAMVVNVIGEDYVRLAEAKGLRKNRILMKYAFKNALLPQVTGLAMSLGFVMNGSYLVEYFFSYPGMGNLFVNAVLMLDYNTIQACILLSVFSVLTANLLIDLIYPLIDPRIKYGG